MPSIPTSAVTFPAGVAVGVGVGGAIGGAIEPRLQAIKNTAWHRFQTMPLLAIQAAQDVANGERTMEWGADEALNTGISEDRFAALVEIFTVAPDLPTLYELLERGLLNEAQFRLAARKLSIKPEYLDGLVQLRHKLLSPAEAANAWQQGYMSEPDASAEAERSGVTPERSLIQRETAGLPPGAMDALGMLRRNLIDEATYRQIVREGHTKVKYTDALLGLRQQLTSPTNAASLHLKGWIDEQERDRLGALSGYDHDAMDRLYLDRGRPATVRQAHIGFARGGRLPGAGNNEEATLRRSVEESNIRTEWFDILYAQRYTYPSAFVLRALATDGTFTQEQTRQILVESGWKPEWADAASTKWAAGGGGTKAKWAERARSRLYTVAHNEYLDESLTEAQAHAILTEIGVAAGEANTVIALWNAESGISRLELTPSQIVKAYKKGNYDEATAMSELQERGYTLEDATTLLQNA